MACRRPAPIHYQIQYWNIVNWTLTNKLQWNLDQIHTFSFKKNVFENMSSGKWRPSCLGLNMLRVNMRTMCMQRCALNMLGLLLGLCPANGRQRYFVTTSLIGCVQAENEPYKRPSVCSRTISHHRSTRVVRIIMTYNGQHVHVKVTSWHDTAVTRHWTYHLRWHLQHRYAFKCVDI